MVGPSQKKPQLPKSILELKFMKKTRDRIQKELDNTEGLDSLYSNIITNEMRHASGNFITESSFIYCEDLIDGRLSFKGMNPEIERLMELRDNKHEDSESDMKKDVSDEILAKKMQAFKKRKVPIDSPNKMPMKKKRQ